MAPTSPTRASGCSIWQACAGAARAARRAASDRGEAHVHAAFVGLMVGGRRQVTTPDEDALGDAIAFAEWRSTPHGSSARCCLDGAARTPPQALGTGGTHDHGHRRDVKEALRRRDRPRARVSTSWTSGWSTACTSTRKHATIDMTLTSAACPLTDVIEDQTRAALDGLVDGLPDQLGVDAAVGPGQDHRRRPRAAARPRLQRLKNQPPSPFALPRRPAFALHVCVRPPGIPGG